MVKVGLMKCASRWFCQFTSYHSSSVFLAELSVNVREFFESVNIVIVHIREVDTFAISVCTKGFTYYLSTL